MGPEQLTGVLDLVMRQAAKRWVNSWGGVPQGAKLGKANSAFACKWNEMNWAELTVGWLFRAGIEIDEEVASTRKQMFQSLVESESDVYYTSARMLDDGIIDPRDTRTVLGFCLSVVYNKEVKGGNLYGVSRM